MSKLHPATRRRTLRMLAAAPYLLLPRSVLAAPSRRWMITGTRVSVRVQVRARKTLSIPSGAAT